MINTPKTVADMFAREGVWTQGGLAKDQEGSYVDPKCPEACQFCLAGAILLVYEDESEKFYEKLKQVGNFILAKCGSRNIGEWNDAPGRTQEEVLALCKELGI